MDAKKCREINQKSAECVLAMWDTIGDTRVWQNDELEYLLLCIIRKLNNHLIEWKGV